MKAIIEGDVSGLRELLPKDNTSPNLLYLAAKHGQVEIIKFLVYEHGVEYNADVANKAMEAADVPLLEWHATKATIWYLLKITEESLPIDQYVETDVLTYSIWYKYNSFKLAKTLLNYITDPVKKQQLLDVHFLYMVVADELEAAQFCVNQGANVHAMNEKSENALQLGFRWKVSKELVHYLLYLKVDHKAEDKYGDTPLALAKTALNDYSGVSTDRTLKICKRPGSSDILSQSESQEEVTSLGESGGDSIETLS